VADRRAARTSRHAGPPPSGLARWLADHQRPADLARGPGQTGAVAERRVAEAPRTRATDSDPPPEPPDREREDDFGDGWRTYGARRPPLPDLRLDGAAAATTRRELAALGRDD